MRSSTAGPGGDLYAEMLRRGITRRAFLKFSAAMASVLALPASYAPRIAAAVSAAPRIPVIWLRGQDCGGNTEAFLQATDPDVSRLVLDLLSIDVHESLMAPAGAAAELSLASTMEQHPDGYIAVVEGGIPTADDGAACTIGGRAFRDVVREVADGALATIAVGSCAFDGGLPAAWGGPTGSVGAGAIVADARVINLPGCPVNVENLTATIVHYLTFGEFPAADLRGRPLFAYGGLVHNQCERRASFEFGQFALAWGDEGAQKGWCLYKMGCKGPEVFANCPTKEYAAGTSWPVKAGHGCVGCTMPGFWDAMSPFYARLPSPVPFARGITTDQIGLALVGGVAAVTVAHGSVAIARNRWAAARAHRAAGRVAGDREAEQVMAPAEATAGAGDGEAPPTTAEATPASAEATQAMADADSAPAASATAEAGGAATSDASGAAAEPEGAGPAEAASAPDARAADPGVTDAGAEAPVEVPPTAGVADGAAESDGPQGPEPIVGPEDR